jgi:dienelactone hydrolase
MRVDAATVTRTWTDAPLWERRFRAPAMTFPSWAREAPDRLVYLSNESGSTQVHAWDRRLGTRRTVTDHPIGVMYATPTPDGEDVVWWHDETGSEVGHWVMEAFHGDARERRSLLKDVPDGWSAGLAMGDQRVVVSIATELGFEVHVGRYGEPARLLHQHEQVVRVGGLSRDGTLLCLGHAEHGDSIHPAMRVIDPESAEVVGDQWDGAGFGLEPAGWSPIHGDQRVAFVHEKEGLDRPGVWDLRTGERRDLPVDLPGDVDVLGWYPDASALLVAHDHQGRSELFRLDLGHTADLGRIPHGDGTVAGARVRPDGELWFQLGSGAEPPVVLAADGHVVAKTGGERAPTGQPFRSFWFDSPKGHRIHGFVVTPPGEGPFPVIMEVHGGPTSAYRDAFRPATQAWVDHGYAVAMVNYRGSTGYGVAFRDALIGDPGFPEIEDVVAGLEHLIADGVVDPTRAVLRGDSWGGYVTLLAAGVQPDRWAAGVAGVPVADYVAAYEDESTELQAFDRNIFGGTPQERPDLYHERSPLTYVDRVTAPLLILAGDHDSRCPIRQILNYLERLEALGHAFEVYRFEAGHGSMVIEERIRQMAAQLAFVTARVPA